MPLNFSLWFGCIVSLMGALACCSSTPAVESPIDEVPVNPPIFDASTPEGAQMEWVLGVLNSDGVLSNEAIEEHFQTSFLTKVPSMALKETMESLALTKPWEPESVFETGENKLVLNVRTQGTIWRVSARVDAEAPHQLVGLFLGPAPKDTIDASTPSGAQAQWAVDTINGADTSAETLTSHFDQAFLAAVSVEAMQGIFASLAPSSPFKIVSVQDPEENKTLVTIEGKEGMVLVLVLVINPAEDNKLSGFLLTPGASTRELPTSFEAIAAEMAQTMSRTQLYVAHIDSTTGACSPIATLGEQGSFAIGSAFKLYILSALGEAVEAGELKWTDEVVIEEAHKSLPSGTMQNAEAGSTFPLSHFANKMIMISDNTATDHLLSKAGREKVEARLAATGHHDPKLNQPFLSTRNMFTLKLGKTAEERAAYLLLDESGRSKALDEMASQPLPPVENAASWTHPMDIDTIEWFATGADLCGVYGDMVKKHALESYQPVFEALSINDGGLQPNKEHWKYVGFKGGSEPGVFFLSYLLQDDAGEWFSISVGYNDLEKDMPIGATPMDMAKAAVQVLETVK